ncbi:MAG TPA: hypothetical protein ENG48_09995 [Candidatus Atribacteria bacterium]|nr:hypothetical protein [Candidatus Atribacteria bacterium]
MNGYLIIILIIILILFLKWDVKEKKTEEDSQEKPKEELGKDTDLRMLQVYYNGGERVKKGKTIKTEEDEITFEVKGYDFEEKEVRLNPNKITWGKSCGCVKWEKEKGLINTAYCKNKGKQERNVWVKYTNGITFPWKIQFK